uniref:Uncharacterized protein n=1 Tax=Salarias fasciatus TaxID=181472 RepID=A0A672IL28_SALFA
SHHFPPEFPFKLEYMSGVGTDPHTALALAPDSKPTKEKSEEPSLQHLDPDEMSIRIGRLSLNHTCSLTNSEWRSTLAVSWEMIRGF